MSITRGVRPIIISIVGIIIIAIAAVVIVNLVNGESPVQNLIYKSLELRDAKNAVDRADLITGLDELVAESNNPRVLDQWNKMLECLSSACPDEAFLDMVLVSVAEYETDVDHSALLINVIATAKYWDNPDHMLDFSKALSTADNQIQELKIRGIEKKWSQIVDCNGQCPEMYDQYFDLIKAIVR